MVQALGKRLEYFKMGYCKYTEFAKSHAVTRMFPRAQVQMIVSALLSRTLLSVSVSCAVVLRCPEADIRSCMAEVRLLRQALQDPV